MKLHFLILVLILGTTSCTGFDVTDEHGDEVAGSIPERASLAPADVIAFEENPFPGQTHFPELRVDRTYLEDVLSNWHSTSANQWLHGYHHLALEDRTGTLSLRDERQIRWMVRPGGLATLSFPDGSVLYLVKKLSNIGVDAESVDATDGASSRR
ncbi:MAG: hypothetical protein ACI8QS_001890 [Planctomycetota bacterium]|jgi:hypothetical protein